MEDTIYDLNLQMYISWNNDECFSFPPHSTNQSVLFILIPWIFLKWDFQKIHSPFGGTYSSQHLLCSETFGKLFIQFVCFGWFMLYNIYHLKCFQLCYELIFGHCSMFSIADSHNVAHKKKKNPTRGYENPFIFFHCCLLALH